jgi:hypothetical protein
MDELHARIDASIADAELTAGRPFKLDATELSRKVSHTVRKHEALL